MPASISWPADTGRLYGGIVPVAAATANAKPFPIETAPRKAVAVALKAANLIGDGLYGVDVKEVNGDFYVIEVNDNPNLDAGIEDGILREELYLRVMRSFLQRIEQQKAPSYG